MKVDPAPSSVPIEPSCALALIAKVPFAGAVKTRLTPPLTPAEAAMLSIWLSPDFEVERQPFLISRSAN